LARQRHTWIDDRSIYLVRARGGTHARQRQSPFTSAKTPPRHCQTCRVRPRHRPAGPCRLAQLFSWLALLAGVFLPSPASLPVAVSSPVRASRRRLRRACRREGERQQEFPVPDAEVFCSPSRQNRANFFFLLNREPCKLLMTGPKSFKCCPKCAYGKVYCRKVFGRVSLSTSRALGSQSDTCHGSPLGVTHFFALVPVVDVIDSNLR
jgi:hypothetical protein